MKGPQFLTYVIPIIKVLQSNGGAGDATFIIDEVIEFLKIPEEEVSKTIPSGQSRIRNQIQWARFYLFKAGLIENGERGIWRLSNDGLESEMDEDDVYALFKRVQDNVKKSDKKEKKKEETEFDETITEEEAHGESLLNIILTLTPSGFEKICKRLLTEIGIRNISITGGSGDQGIDGKGIVQLNDVVSLNIVFQCKRYKDVVSPHHVRDFRGAMQGRGEKGLIISTGRFTKEAISEANREGVTPIELIDGERLVNLFEKHKLGLKPVTVFEIDYEFFKGFY